jgi:hypothetical protein
MRVTKRNKRTVKKTTKQIRIYGCHILTDWNKNLHLPASCAEHWNIHRFLGNNNTQVFQMRPHFHLSCLTKLLTQIKQTCHSVDEKVDDRVSTVEVK